MRTLSAALQNAHASEHGIKPSINLKLYKSKVFFESITRDNEVSFSPSTAEVSETPVAEDIGYSSGSTIGVASSSDQLYIMIDGDSTEKVLFTSGSGIIATLTECKPALSLPYVFYFNGTAIIRGELDLANITSGSCPVINLSTVATVADGGSLSSLSDTEVVHVYIKDGGVGVTYYEYDGSWTAYEFGQRFMYRTQLYDNDEVAYVHRMVYSAAAKTSNGIFVYVYDYDGSVSVVQRKTNGAWTDITTAIPSDLSEFRPTNAIVKDDRVYLAGQFIRTKEFYTDSIHNLVLWSDDGLTFSLDRFTMFSTLGWRFHICEKGDDILFANTNRILEDTAPWYFSKEDSDYIEITSGSVISFNGSASSDWGLMLVSDYIDNEYVTIGNRILIQLGYNTSGSMIYFDYDTCILSSKKKGIKDGERNISINAMSEGMWRTSNLTHPFYMEFNSKQASHDRIQDMGGLYEAADSDDCYPIPFMVDFSDGSGIIDSHEEISAGANFTLWTVDFDETEMTDYPVLDSFPYVGELYGWSRSGQWDLNPNTPDSTPTSSVNPRMTLMLLVEHTDGDQEEIEITDLASTHDHFQQTYFTASARAGSLPIQYNITETGNLVSGDLLIKVGIKAYNENASGKVVMMGARIEIPTLDMCVSPPDFSADGIEEDDDAIYIPPGLPIIKGTLAQYFPFPDGYAVVDSFNEQTISWHWNKTENDIDNKIWPGVSLDWNGNTSISSMVIEVINHDSCAGATPRWQQSFTSYGSTFTNIGGNLWECGSQWYGAPVNNGIGFHLSAPGGVSRWDFTVTIISINGIPYGTDERVQYPTEYDSDGDLIPEKALVIKQRGRPKIYFAVKPYSTFNFDIWAYVKIIGDYGYAGLVGLAEDAKNYIVARWTETSIEIIKVRNRVETVLASDVVSWDDTERILFSHENGVFTVRRIVSSSFGAPLLTYTWQESDGALTTTEDILHVGIYGFIDSPGLGLRTTSFSGSNSNGILAILPGYVSGAYSDLPSSGTIELDGKKYSYSGKSSEMSVIRGPYQFRNFGINWSYTNPSDGKHFSGNTMAMYMFDWLNNNTYYTKHNANYIGTSVCKAYTISAIDWKVWITTGGALVWLRNRCRIYSSQISAGEYMGTGDKVWVTHALTGVTPIEEEGSYYHSEGTFVIYVGDGTNDDQIMFKEFCANDGNQDASVEDMLAKVTKIAGAVASFPGDTLYTTLALDTSSEETI